MGQYLQLWNFGIPVVFQLQYRNLQKMLLILDIYLMFQHWLNLNNRIRNPVVIQERFYLTTKGASCVAIKYKWSRFQFFFFMFHS